MSPLLTSSIESLRPGDLQGFFEGWPRPPTPEQHLELLRRSDERLLAVEAGGEVVGFITALTDGVLAAYIPLLEVRREWRGRGIGTLLARAMLERLDNYYMVDVVCDGDVLPFYERLGLERWTAAIRRRRHARP